MTETEALDKLHSLAWTEAEVKTISPFKITSQNDLIKSVELLSRCNVYLDKLTADKELLTAPLNTTLKEIRARYKPVSDQLERVIADIRKEQSLYQTQLVARQRAEEQAIADKLSSGKIKKVETALKAMDKVEKAEQMFMAESGTVRFRTDQKLKIWDHTLIPLEYYNLNESRLLKALKAGIVVSGAGLEEIQIPVNHR